MIQKGGVSMYDRKVTLPLTEDEWRSLCATAKSADRTPKLQARHLVRAALGLTEEKNNGDVLARLRELLETTPPHSLATRPVKRALIEAAVKEIERLRNTAAEAPR